MRYLTIILLLTLTACGSVQDKIDELKSQVDDSPLSNLLEDLWDGDYREKSTNFIINYPIGAVPEPILPSIEKLWEGLKTCTGFDVDISQAPLILSYLAVDDLTNPDYGGFAWLDISYTEIVINDLYDTENWVQYNITQNMLLRYMLYRTGSTLEEIGDETSPYFNECLSLEEES